MSIHGLFVYLFYKTEVPKVHLQLQYGGFYFVAVHDFLCRKSRSQPLAVTTARHFFALFATFDYFLDIIQKKTNLTLLVIRKESPKKLILITFDHFWPLVGH